MKSTRSRKQLRHDRILSVLRDNPSLRVNQLADALEVSNETIRRDLAELDALGRLNRTYGGAVSTTNRFEPGLNERLLLNVHERRAIARTATRRYAGEEALLLGGGATMVEFARILRDIRYRLTVITPAYPVAVELASNPMIDVMLLPGILEHQEGVVYGPETIRALKRYRAPVAIIGASGINHEGITEAMLNIGEVYAEMLRNADQRTILADYSKFGKRALVLLSGWAPGMTLITDREPDTVIMSALREGGASVEIAGQEV